MGAVRFVYRLLPGPFRYVTSYVLAMERLGRPVGVPLLSKLAAALTRVSLRLMLQPPPPDMLQKVLTLRQVATSAVAQHV